MSKLAGSIYGFGGRIVALGAVSAALFMSSCDNTPVKYDPKALGFSSQAEMEAAFAKGYQTKQKLDEMTKPASASAATAQPAAPNGSASAVVGEAVPIPTDCEGLWHARNEIFHKNGYCFSTERGIKAFGNDGCTTHGVPALSGDDRLRVAELKAAEQRLACRGDTSTPPTSVAGGGGGDTSTPTRQVQPESNRSRRVAIVDYNGSTPLKCYQNLNCASLEDVVSKMQIRWQSYSSSTPYSSACLAAIARMREMQSAWSVWSDQQRIGVAMNQTGICNAR